MGDVVTIDGPCPMLTCYQTRPHTHPVCPDCGATRYGNLLCATCKDRRAPTVAVEEFRRLNALLGKQVLILPEPARRLLMGDPAPVIPTLAHLTSVTATETFDVYGQIRPNGARIASWRITEED